MEKLPHFPKSLSNIRKKTQVSPTAIRMIRDVVNSRDTSKLIKLSSTVRNLSARPLNESSELTLQLATLRKNLDKYSLVNHHKENRLRQLKSKLKELKVKEIITNDDVKRENYYYKLMEDIKNVQLQELDELETQRIYEFINERLRITVDFLEKKDIKLHKQLELATHSAQNQSRLRKDTIDSVNQYKIAYKSAVKALKYEKSALETELSRMETQSKLKKSIITKTEEHNKHRLEIVEQTMIDERSAHLEEIKTGVLLHRMYEKTLSRKMIFIKEVFNRLDSAFQRVRIKTGLYNIEEVIEKFLTQEANYKALTDNLHRKEVECSEYKKKISEMQEKVASLAEEKLEKKSGHDMMKDALNRLLRSKEKAAEMDKLKLKMHIWVENYTKKASGGIEGDDFKSFSLREKFARLKDLVKIMLMNVDFGDKKAGDINSLRSLSMDEIRLLYTQVRIRKLSNNSEKAASQGRTPHRIRDST
ncbi:hypothetical protein SteCoe_2792 [Stentor coeruleus]|uniref:Uncharacterized protein n=1 Tax=Stentor coeruleus TaxID=5963 RepID=A0A1R2CYU2_9CILI|nr:hypothetical protein SteCoe_2792 [Stentor coeruleus]